jgi:shikimate dehydrogenase
MSTAQSKNILGLVILFLCNILFIMQKGQYMSKYLVIGDPIEHSLSPEMQNAGFEALGLGRPYGKRRVTLEEFPEFVRFARENLKGFNITVPHKQTIIPYLDSISREAELARSVNTVTVKNGKLHGDSTDGYGLEAALKEAFGVEVKNGSFFFIGCGGAVQAVAFHFAARGAKRLMFANRTVAKAEALIDSLQDAFPNSDFACCSINDLGTVEDFIDIASVAVQGTSLGLKPDDLPPVPPELLRNICYYDTIYKRTPLLEAAAGKGLRTADGRSMLLHQGARSFEIWTEEDAPLDAMRSALYAAMERRMGGK